jgi:hypothetical protein
MNNHTVSIDSALVYIPNNSVWVFLFPHILASIDCFLNDSSHSDWGKLETQYSYDLHFLYSKECWTSFHVFIRHIYFFLLRTLCSFAHLLIGLFSLLLFKFLSSLYIVDINPLSDKHLAKIFLPFCELSFTTSNCFLYVQKVFSFR